MTRTPPDLPEPARRQRTLRMPPESGTTSPAVGCSAIGGESAAFFLSPVKWPLALKKQRFDNCEHVIAIRLRRIVVQCDDELPKRSAARPERRDPGPGSIEFERAGLNTRSRPVLSNENLQAADARHRLALCRLPGAGLPRNAVIRGRDPGQVQLSKQGIILPLVTRSKILLANLVQAS